MSALVRCLTTNHPPVGDSRDTARRMRTRARTRMMTDEGRMTTMLSSVMET